ncbi:MAG TPA: GDSL-type esterase/lipase family protein [Opitutaceae bacterium]|nr:GDSL-type esterase/lipase family protein [Opitutaceae bacterium]
MFSLVPRFPSARSLAGLFALTVLASVGAADTKHAPHPPWNENGRIGHRQLVEKAKQGRIDVYFLGDSITRRWGALDYPEFLAHWNRTFLGWNAANFGWGGDSTHNMLWRVTNGEFEGLSPKVIVLLAGTNNIGDKPKPGAADDAVEGIQTLLETLQAKAPQATIVLMAVFPRNDNPESNQAVAEVNARIAEFADGKRIRFLNINDQLAGPDGTFFGGISVDKLHLSVKGYEVWAKNLVPVLTELLGAPAAEDNAPPPTGDPAALKRK